MTNIELHRKLCRDLNKLYEQKNKDYGDSFHETFIEEGFAMSRIRLSDKLSRFKQLSRKPDEQCVADESIRDTLIDLANYALMTVLEMDLSREEGIKQEVISKIEPAMSHPGGTWSYPASCGCSAYVQDRLFIC